MPSLAIANGDELSPEEIIWLQKGKQDSVCFVSTTVCKTHTIGKHITCLSWVLYRTLDGIGEGYMSALDNKVYDDPSAVINTHGINRENYHVYEALKIVPIVSGFIASRYWKPEHESKKKLAVEIIATGLIGEFCRDMAISRVQSNQWFARNEDYKWELQITNNFSFKFGRLNKEQSIFLGALGMIMYIATSMKGE